MTLYALAIFSLLAIVALDLFDRLPRGVAIVATDRYICGNTAGLWTCTIDRRGATCTARLIAKKDRGYNHALDARPAHAATFEYGRVDLTLGVIAPARDTDDVDKTQEIDIATLDRVWIQDRLAITEIRADRLAESVSESMDLLVNQLRKDGPQDLAMEHAKIIRSAAQLIVWEIDHAIMHAETLQMFDRVG